MPSLSRRLSLVVLLALLAAILPAPRPAFALGLEVNSLADTNDGSCTATAGGCTLREAINAANASAAADVITFSVSGTIAPTSPLPDLTGGGDTIDATSRAHQLILSGQAMAAASPIVPSQGLRIRSANNTIRGLVIISFPFVTSAAFGGVGVHITGTGASGNKLYDNWIGVAANGTNAAGNGFAGVLLDDGASNNDIGGSAAGQPNVIAGNLRANVMVDNFAGTASVAANNRIVGNLIGTNTAGTAAIANANNNGLDAGVLVAEYASDTVIRGNLIGGHTGSSVAAGIKLLTDVLSSGDLGRAATGTSIVGNRIGVTATGVAIPNRVGILLSGGARFGALETTIGDPANLAGGRNYIAGNSEQGIEIEDSTRPMGNVTIVGNHIGLAPNGARVFNGSSAAGEGTGILVGIDTSASTIATVGPGNVIAASYYFQVHIRASGTVLKGNFIGTDPAGGTTSASTSTTPGYGSRGLSVWLENGANVQIGGPSPADRNVIANGGTLQYGTAAPILVDPRARTSTTPCNGQACSVTGALIEGNHIGVTAAGSGVLNTNKSAVNAVDGIRIRNTSGATVRGNVIGGLGQGILLDLGANSNSITANRIGVSSTGGNLGNNNEGLRILGSTGNTVRDNLIAFNAAYLNASTGASGIPAVRVGTAASPADNNDFIGNTVFSNGSNTAGSGYLIDSSEGVTISEGGTYNNREAGIFLNNANLGRQAPTLNTPATAASTITGSTSCGQGCSVELFTGAAALTDRNEGPVFLAAATSGAGGAFSLPLAGCLGWVTATVRDVAGNSSPFSSPVDLTGNTTCQPVTITLSPDYQRDVAPGGSTTYIHTISHNSAIERTYEIRLTSNPARGWASAPATVTVPANGSVQFNVTVSVPAGTPLDTVDTTTVQAFLGATGSNIVTDRTTVRQATVVPATPQVSPGQTLPLNTGQTVFEHTVTNIGDVAGTFEVVPNPPAFSGTAPAGWSISASLADPTLDPGQSTTLTITVTNPAPLPSGDVSFSFRVRAGAQQSDPLTVDTIDVPVVRSFTFTRTTASPQIVPAGGQASFTFRLTNTGNATDTFRVPAPTATTPVTTPDPITFAVNPSGDFQLAPNAFRDVVVTATVPGATPAATYSFNTTAQAVGGSGAPAPITVSNTEIEVTGGGVPVFLSTSTSPAQADFETATEVAITYNLRNGGNAPAPFSFAPVLPLPAGMTQVGTISTTCPSPLPSGATCSAVLTVSVPAGLTAGNYTVRLQATADNTSSPDASATGTATVVVETVRQVEIDAGTPLSPQLIAPGGIVTFTHTVRNTGNITDSYDLSFSQTQAGWATVLNPTELLNVPRDQERTVTVQVTVPTGVTAGLTNDLQVTVRSKADNAVSDSATDTVEVLAEDGADLSPEPPQNTQDDTTVTFTHTLTNTGSTTIAYEVLGENSQASWPAPVITLADTGPLAPGATTEVTVQVSVPAGVTGGISNTTTLRVLAAGTSEPVLDEEQDVTRVGDPLAVLITPNRTGTGLPSATATFTHTVTNVGFERDSYRLSAAEAAGVPVSVAPDLLDLDAGQSAVISVTLLLPSGIRAGSEIFTRVTATSLSNPAVTGSATVSLTVGRVAGVELSAGQVRGVDGAGGQLSLDTLSLVNTGNAADSFDLTFEDVTGEPGGLLVLLTPDEVSLEQGAAQRGIAATVTAPGSVPASRTRKVRVVARSSFDPSVTASIIVDVVYLVPPPPPPSGVNLYLPYVPR